MRLATAVAVAVALAASPSGPHAQTADTAPKAAPEPVPRAEPVPAPKAAAPSTGGPAATPSGPASELARALLTQEQWSKVLDSYASSLAGQVSEALLSRGEKVPDDLRPKLRGELDRALPYQQTVQAQAEALSKALTPDELKRTAAFYRSPLGRKVLERLPDAQSAAAQQLQGRLATAVPEIVNRVAPKAMASAPPAGGGAPGAPGGAGGQSPPVQGRRPPPEAGGSR